MKCPECGGTGEMHEEFIIPLWHGEGDNIIKFTGIVSDMDDHEDVADCARRFHKLLRAHAHGVFHDTLRDCFMEER